MPEKSTAIKTEKLVKKFGDLTAVDELSIEICKGEIFGFLGPNGAGKTTAINMICGISEPTKGEVLISRNSIRNRESIKNLIGICPQENVFWPKLTCFEQLVFMGEMYSKTGRPLKSRAREMLKALALEEKSNVQARKLSGGMQRRLNICLALIHDPEIIILDEPEAGLDPQSRILVREYIKSLAGEKTIILTTHNMDEADRLSDRVAIIDHGRLLLLDTPENLKKSIGEGDLLEITLKKTGDKNIEKISEILSKTCESVILSGTSLIIKSKNLINTLSDITETIKRNGFKIDEIKMRENTLEDVFIHLTGRKLRQ